MKTRIDYTCKFCGRPRVIECDIPPDCPQLNLEAWKKMLVCNSCADYERARRDTERKVAQQLASLVAVRYGVQNADRLAQVEEKCHMNLTFLTKKFCELVCNRHGKPISWEPEIVDYLMKQPDKPFDILNHFKKTMGFVVQPT